MKFLASTVCCAFAGAALAAVSPLVDGTRVISTPADRYCGWPTVTRTGANELTAVFSGYREGHVCPYGQIRRVRSTDGGRTWSKSDILENGLLDDRDTGVLRLANGDLVLFWFTSTAFRDYYLMWGTNLAQRVRSNPYLSNMKADYVRHYDSLDPAAVRAALGGFAKRSTDGGRTWGEKVRLPTPSSHTPHGAIQLRDGRLMLVGEDRRVNVSSDGGRTWSVLSRLPHPPESTCEGQKLGFCEAYLLEGEDGVLRCYIRTEIALYSESTDGGRTWTVPAPTKITSRQSPIHLLKLADGRFLMTTARRSGNPGCIFARVGDRNGTLAAFEAAEEIVLNEQKGHDFGYSSSAQNADGSLVTVFYAHPVNEGDAAAIYAVRWHLNGTEEGIGKYDPAMAQERVPAVKGIDWIDGRKLPIEGRAFDDTEHYYDRLPANVTTNVNAGVRRMKHHTSGMAFRFATDSRKLRFRWRVYDPKQLEMQHMPRTGVSGIDVYRQAADGRWFFVRSGCPAMGKATDGDTFEFEISWTPGTPCLVYLPLYNGIRSFALGVETGRGVRPLPARRSGVTKPVVFYGTSITHGGCCSRPGMSFPAIIGRKLDVPIVNLGFSGSGAMELEMADHLARIDASCYVLDCLWNMGYGNRPYKEGRQVDRVYEPFIRRLRARRPDVPIVMAEQCDVYGHGRNEKEIFIRALHGRLLAEGWKSLVYLPKEGMYSGSMEETVDGAHASDLGMVSLAEAYGKAVAKALEAAAPGL